MAQRSNIYLAIQTGDTHAQTIEDRHIRAYSADDAVEVLRNLLERLEGGTEDGRVFCVQDTGDDTAATGTIACTQANASAGDTLTIAGVVFTVADSPDSDPSKGEFAAETSNTVMGDALAAAINAHPALKGLLSAANAAGTVTVTLRGGGPLGNELAMAETGTSMAVTDPTNGAIGTLQSSLRALVRGL